MKLLPFIFLVSLAMGQAKKPIPIDTGSIQAGWYIQPSSLFSVEQTEALNSKTMDIPDTSIRKEYFVLAFLDLYSRYQNECYADSTLQTYWIFNDGDRQFKSLADPHAIDPGFVPHQTVTQWDHAQPTFSGFINWLREERAK